MDWAKHIEINRQALIAIVAALVRVVRLSVSREARLQVLRTLRPAEAAVRRLIVIAARGLSLKPSVPRPMPPGLSKQLRLRRKDRAVRPVFQLADPFMPMVEPAHKPYAKQGPRISSVSPADPTITAVFGAQANTQHSSPADAPDAGLVLMRRLEAIERALGNLPREAKRLMRWKARRAAIAATRPILTSPLRPGRAPYLPKTLTRNVDYVLERCHLLARESVLTDTS
jgi:hypothetical protein